MLTEKISHSGLSPSSQWDIMLLGGDLCPTLAMTMERVYRNQDFRKVPKILWLNQCWSLS